METNAILLKELSIEQLQQLIGTSVKNGIQELQKELQQKTIPKNYFPGMKLVNS